MPVILAEETVRNYKMDSFSSVMPDPDPVSSV